MKLNSKIESPRNVAREKVGRTGSKVEILADVAAFLEEVDHREAIDDKWTSGSLDVTDGSVN